MIGVGAITAKTTQSALLLPSRFYAGDDGRVYCDFPAQLGYGTGLTGVPLMSTGGGFGRYVQTGQPAKTNGAEPEKLPQVLVLFVGPAKRPFAFGQVTAMNGTRPAEVAVEDDERAVGLGVEDHGAVNGGAVLALTADGRVNVDLRDAGDPTLAVQLPAGGVVRVSRDGDATGRLVLRDELVDYLSDFRAEILAWANLLLGATAVPVPTLSNPTTRTFGAAVLPVSPDAE